MQSYTDKTALITGASSGIGEAFARALAARGMHVILVARSEQRLRELAQELAQAYHIRAEVIPSDLSQEQAAWAIQREVQARGLTVDLLINNAGFGTYGHYTHLDPQRDHEQVMVNVTSVVDLAHAFLPAMAERRAGALINVSSLSAFQSFPYMAVYPASKAFVPALSEALTAEYKEYGVDVLALCPGEVKTNFAKIAGVPSPPGPKLVPEQVVEAALKGLERGRSLVIPGAHNQMMRRVWSLIPRRVFAHAMATSLKPRHHHGARTLAEKGEKRAQP